MAGFPHGISHILNPLMLFQRLTAQKVYHIVSEVNIGYFYGAI